jgi:hypothetical protein
MLLCEIHATRAAVRRQHWQRRTEPLGGKQESGFTTTNAAAACRSLLAPA